MCKYVERNCLSADSALCLFIYVWRLHFLLCWFIPTQTDGLQKIQLLSDMCSLLVSISQAQTPIEACKKLYRQKRKEKLDKMSSGTAPYATLSDLPRFEKRGKVTSAPWMKEQAVPHNGRAHNHEPYITCNSQTAPFATFHNQPLPLEVRVPPLCLLSHWTFWWTRFFLSLEPLIFLWVY